MENLEVLHSFRQGNSESTFSAVPWVLDLGSLSHVWFFPTPWTVKPARLLCPRDFPGKNSGCAELLQSCLTLCDPMDYSPPGSSVQGILQAWILEWAAMPSSSRSSQPRGQTRVSYLSCADRWILYHWEAPLGSLEWGAISYARESSQPRDQTHVSCNSCTGRQVLCP